MRETKSAPFSNNITSVKTVDGQKDDRKIDKEENKGNKKPFKNASKFYHNDVPLVSV